MCSDSRHEHKNNLDDYCDGVLNSSILPEMLTADHTLNCDSRDFCATGRAGTLARARAHTQDIFFFKRILDSKIICFRASLTWLSGALEPIPSDWKRAW